MAKVHPALKTNGYSCDGWLIKCPACKRYHFIPGDGRWTFNGDNERPTFRPSVNESCNAPGPNHRPKIPYTRCHYIITNGKIQFCDDCTHELKNQTVELLEATPGT